jgi:molybdate transport system ATP-binding protein
VADLIGTNLLRGVATGTTVRVGEATVELADSASGDTFLTVAPSAITVHTLRPEGSARNVWAAAVTAIDLLGDRVRVHLAGPVDLVAEITPAALTALGLQIGDHVWASAKATEIASYAG